MSYSIVVARYQEDVDWVNDLKYIFINTRIQPFIYNKGTPLEHYPLSYISLSNVGRESHTYLYHIIHNYDNLSDLVFFTQGNPFDHSPEFLDIMNQIIDSQEDFSPSPFPDFQPLSRTILTSNVANCPHHKGLPLKRVYQQIADKNVESLAIRFSPGALFSVTREAIRRHPREYYEKLIKMVDYDINPIEGFCFERLWGEIFSRKL